MELSNKPLSPHLTIYNPQISSVLSISHRLSGFFLYFGLLLLSWVIIFSTFKDLLIANHFLLATKYVFSSLIGKIIIFLWVLALNYHFLNGIRHLIWDKGLGFSIESVKKSGVLIIFLAVFFTLLSWLFIYQKIFYYV